ncbi:MAG: metal ABC transporter permease, partial [Planctomycetota bacterium]
EIAGLEVARPVVVLGAVALANLILVALLYKELKLATFDSALAATLGLSPVLVHYLLMGAVSVTTVASFESVGAILVVAFLIVPPAAAHLLTDRLSWMLALSVLLGVASAAAGLAAATAWNASIAGCMAVAMGAVFLLAWLLAPKEGILGRIVRHRRVRTRYAEALLLELLERAPAAPNGLAGDLRWPAERVARVLGTLRARGLVEESGALLQPTAAGIRFARATVE